MKLDARRIEAFLGDPGATRVVLLYGDDPGLIADRAGRLVRAVAGDAADPFRVADLGRDGIARIAEEMTALSLSGGRRVVRVREATDAATPAAEAALAGPGSALLVLEAAGLPSRSRLRGVVERSAAAAAIACYALEGAAMARDIRARLQTEGVAIEDAALNWLQEQLAGSDLAAARGEVGKLALYVGPGGTADLAAVQASAGGVAAASLDDALLGATLGDAPRTDRALSLALAEGAAPVAILRGALLHVQRLQRARLAMDAGASAEEAARGVRPPLFFRREGEFVRALRLWPAARLAAAAAALWRDESACKRTGAPDAVLCRTALLNLAMRAAAGRRA